MSAQGTRYIGEIRVGGDTPTFRKPYQVAFGTAAFDLAVLSLRQGSQPEGTPIQVNLFDGFGTGVVCRRTVVVGGLLQKSQTIVYLGEIKGSAAQSIGQAQGCACFFLFPSLNEFLFLQPFSPGAHGL
jgi:hypothetical protein